MPRSFEGWRSVDSSKGLKWSLSKLLGKAGGVGSVLKKHMGSCSYLKIILILKS